MSPFRVATPSLHLRLRSVCLCVVAPWPYGFTKSTSTSVLLSSVPPRRSFPGIQGGALMPRTQQLTYESLAVRRARWAPRDTSIYESSLRVCCDASLTKCGAAARPTTPQPQPIHTCLASDRRKTRSGTVCDHTASARRRDTTTSRPRVLCVCPVSQPQSSDTATLPPPPTCSASM